MATIKIRRGTKSQLDGLLSGTPLFMGELGFTTDTHEVYCGDGTNHHLIGAVIVDIFVNRPTAGEAGRMFHATDTDSTYVDDGVAWVDVSSGISSLDDVPDGTTYARAKVGALNNGYIVQLTDNTGANPLTKTSIDGHIGDDTKHRLINDVGTSNTDLWSASKIEDEIALVVSGLDPQQSVISQSDLTSTVTPSLDDRYINTVTGTAADGGGAITANNIYQWNGSTWDETVATEGMSTWDEALDSNYVYNGSDWVKLGSTVTHNNLAGLQGGTTDEYYHLTSAQHTALFDHWTIQDGDATSYDISNGETVQFAEGVGMDVDFTSENVLTFTNTAPHIATDVSLTHNLNDVTLASSTGTGDTIDAAVAGVSAGVMTSADKTKFDGIDTGANNYVHPSYDGDDLEVDTGGLSGATVISNIDFNVTTDTNGHVTDATLTTLSTRELSLANLGLTVSNTSSIDMTLTANDITADLTEADGGTFV